MYQTRASVRTILPRAGPGAPADSELRVAQKLGRQLAEIGDELNRHYIDAPANPWLLPVLRAAHANRLARIRMYRSARVWLTPTAGLLGCSLLCYWLLQ